MTSLLNGFSTLITYFMQYTPTFFVPFIVAGVFALLLRLVLDII